MEPYRELQERIIKLSEQPDPVLDEQTRQAVASRRAIHQEHVAAQKVVDASKPRSLDKK